LDLQSGDRVRPMRAPDRVCADFRQAHAADVAGLDKLCNRAYGLLNRHRGIEAAGTVDVDIVGLEPAQRVGDEILHGRRPGVDAEPRAGGIAQCAELDADHGAAAPPAAYPRAEPLLVMAHAAVAAGIAEGDSGVQRGLP